MPPTLGCLHPTQLTPVSTRSGLTPSGSAAAGGKETFPRSHTPRRGHKEAHGRSGSCPDAEARLRWLFAVCRLQATRQSQETWGLSSWKTAREHIQYLCQGLQVFMGPTSPPTAGLRGRDGEVSPSASALWVTGQKSSPSKTKPRNTRGSSQGPRPPTTREGRGRVCTALSWVLGPGPARGVRAGHRGQSTPDRPVAPIQLRAFLPERLCTGHPRGIWRARGPGQVSSLGARMPPEALEPAPEGRPRWTQLVVVSGERAPGRAEEG